MKNDGLTGMDRRGKALTIWTLAAIAVLTITGGAWAQFEAVTGITDVPSTGTVGTDVTLSGTVEPSNATNKTIIWSLGTGSTAAGAAVTAGKASATGAGTVVVTATITDGTAVGTDFTDEFTITFSTPATYTVTLTQPTNGTLTAAIVNGSPSAGPLSVTSGNRVFFIATPNNVYDVEAWVTTASLKDSSLKIEEYPTDSKTWIAKDTITVNSDITVSFSTRAIEETKNIAVAIVEEALVDDLGWRLDGGTYFDTVTTAEVMNTPGATAITANDLATYVTGLVADIEDIVKDSLENVKVTFVKDNTFTNDDNSAVPAPDFKDDPVKGWTYTYYVQIERNPKANKKFTLRERAFKITWDAGVGGTITSVTVPTSPTPTSISQGDSVATSKKINFVATPKSDSVVDKWKVANADQTDPTPITNFELVMSTVNADTKVDVSFRQPPAELTITPTLVSTSETIGDINSNGWNTVLTVENKGAGVYAIKDISFSDANENSLVIMGSVTNAPYSWAVLSMFANQNIAASTGKFYLKISLKDSWKTSVAVADQFKAKVIFGGQTGKDVDITLEVLADNVAKLGVVPQVVNDSVALATVTVSGWYDTLKISNAGNTAYDVTGISIDPVANAPFEIIGGSTSATGPFTTLTGTIAENTGVLYLQIGLTSTAKMSATKTSNFTGAVKFAGQNAATVNIALATVEYAATIDKITFADVNAPHTSTAAQTVKVNATGTGHLKNVKVTSSNTTDFVLAGAGTNGEIANIAAGQSSSTAVTLKPADNRPGGTYTTTLSVAADGLTNVDSVITFTVKSVAVTPPTAPAVTYGTAGSFSLTVSTTGIAAGPYTPTIAVSVVNAPDGGMTLPTTTNPLTLAVNSGTGKMEGTIALSTTDATPAGTYKFKLTVDNVQSEEFEVTVAPISIDVSKLTVKVEKTYDANMTILDGYITVEAPSELTTTDKTAWDNKTNNVLTNYKVDKGTIAFTDANVATSVPISKGTAVNAKDATLTLLGAFATNYTPSTTTLTIANGVINPVELRPGAVTVTKVYSKTNSIASANVTVAAPTAGWVGQDAAKWTNSAAGYTVDPDGATFDDVNVGTRNIDATTVTPTLTLGTALSNYKLATSASTPPYTFALPATGTITKAPLTLVADAGIVSKEYNGKYDIADKDVTVTVPTGWVTGDDPVDLWIRDNYTVSPGTSVFASVNVGASIVITKAGTRTLTLGTELDNYMIASSPAFDLKTPGAIVKATVTDDNKDYHVAYNNSTHKIELKQTPTPLTGSGTITTCFSTLDVFSAADTVCDYPIDKENETRYLWFIIAGGTNYEQVSDPLSLGETVIEGQPRIKITEQDKPLAAGLAGTVTYTVTFENWRSDPTTASAINLMSVTGANGYLQLDPNNVNTETAVPSTGKGVTYSLGAIQQTGKNGNLWSGRATMTVTLTTASSSLTTTYLTLTYPSGTATSKATAPFVLKVGRLKANPSELRQFVPVVQGTRIPPAEQKVTIEKAGAAATLRFEFVSANCPTCVTLPGLNPNYYYVRQGSSKTPVATRGGIEDTIRVTGTNDAIWISPAFDNTWLPGRYDGYIVITIGTEEHARIKVSFEVLPSDIAAIFPDPEDLTFGALPAKYKQPPAQTVTIYNTGTKPVILDKPVPRDDYDIVMWPSQDGLYLPANGSSVMFDIQPKAGLGVPGKNESNVTIDGDYEYNNPIVISGRGIGGIDAVSGDTTFVPVADAVINVEFTVEGSGAYKISAAGLTTFGSKDYSVKGPQYYTMPDSQIVRVYSVGRGTGAITISLPKSLENKYDIYDYAQSLVPWTGAVGSKTAVIMSGGDPAAFSIRPKTNLLAGVHSEKIAIIGKSNAANCTTYVYPTFTLRATRSISAVPRDTVFDDTVVGYKTLQTIRIDVSNTSDSAVVLKSTTPTFKHGAASVFTIAAPMKTATLARDSSVWFTVSPKRTGMDAGTYTDTILIEGADAGGGGAKAAVALSFTIGDSIRHIISLDRVPAKIDFGNVIFGTSISTTDPNEEGYVTIVNNGTAIIELTDAVFSDKTSSAESKFEIRDVTWPVTLLPGDAATATPKGEVRFRVLPRADLAIGGPYSAKVTVNGVGENKTSKVSVNLDVVCSVVPGETKGISASPLVLSFGSKGKPYTQPGAKSVTVTNNTAGTVTLNDLRSGDKVGSLGYYEVVGNLSKTVLNKGDQATFNVRPVGGLDVGVRNDNIAVRGLAANNDPVVATVSATFEVLPGLPVVTFEVNGGEELVPYQLTTGSTKRLSSLPMPKRDRYTWDGWFFEDDVDGDDLTKKITTSTVFSFDTTVYARWTPYGETPYTVTFGAGTNGALTATDNGEPIESGHVGRNGDNIVFTAEPIDGYRVVRWTVNNSVISDTSRTYTVAVLSRDMNVTATFDRNVNVGSSDRGVSGGAGVEVVSVSPASALSAALAAGPNPASKPSGEMGFFRSGPRVAKSALFVYDASGNVVRKIYVSDDAPMVKGSRKIAVWDLRDASGRLVSDGTYLVKGVVIANGKRERVSAVVGVR